MAQILIIDIETTGFLKAGGKIVEIGICELDLETGERKKIFDEVCHEDGIYRAEVERSWIVKNSDITVDEIRRSKNLKLLKPKIQEILYRYFSGATAFNNKFDFDFLEDRGFVFPKKLPCPMLLAKDVCKLPGKFNDYKWPKVQEAYDHLFSPHDYVEKHRGYDDAHHEAEIVYELYLRGLFKID